MRSVVESPDGNAARRRKDRGGHLLAAQPRAPCRRLVVVDFEHGQRRFPVRGDEAHFGRGLHDPAGAVGQRVQHGRVGPREERLDRVFLVHDVVAFELHVGVRIAVRQDALYLVHVLLQRLRRGEVDNQLAVRQRRRGDAPHEVVTGRRAADRGGHRADLGAGF